MNTCEEKLEKMSVTFKKINRSRNSNLKMNNMMRLLIIDMLTNSKGWIEGDIDNRAIDLLNNFQRIKDGIQE